CSSSSPNRAVSAHDTGRTVRSPVHEATTGILPVTHAYVHLILKVPGGALRQATLTDTAERWPRPAGPAGDRQAISGDPKADLRPCAEGRASVDGHRRAVAPAPPAAADGARDRHGSPERRVRCPAGGPGRAAAQAEDRH